jgi:hypothetical protein
MSSLGDSKCFNKKFIEQMKVENNKHTPRLDKLLELSIIGIQPLFFISDVFVSKPQNIG